MVITFSTVHTATLVILMFLQPPDTLPSDPSPTAFSAHPTQILPFPLTSIPRFLFNLLSMSRPRTTMSPPRHRPPLLTHMPLHALRLALSALGSKTPFYVFSTVSSTFLIFPRLVLIPRSSSPRRLVFQPLAAAKSSRCLPATFRRYPRRTVPFSTGSFIITFLPTRRASLPLLRCPRLPVRPPTLLMTLFDMSKVSSALSNGGD